MKGLKPATRIARLEDDAQRLSERIRQAQVVFDSDRLQMAWGHVQAALTDLRIAKIGATPRRETR